MSVAQRWGFAVLATILGSALTWTAVAAWPGHLDTQSAASVVGVVAALILGPAGWWAQQGAADRALLASPAGPVPVQSRGPVDAGQQLVVGDLPGQAVGWQDRVELLDQLTLMAGHSRTAVVCAVAGQRGIGKTQLAAAYARARVAEGWPVVAWVVADTSANLVTGLDKLAAAAGVRQPDTDPTDAARAALAWLRTQPGPCLLVYDNALDPDLIRTWTPPVGAVHIVVTTTRYDFVNLGESLDVTLFTPTEAVTYLRTRTGLADDTAAAQLAEELGRLPLALAQAGAVIGPRRRYRTYRAYLDRLATTSVADLLPPASGGDYPHSAAQAILLAVDDLAAADPGGHARRLLDHLAVLAPAGADPVLLRHLAAPPRPTGRRRWWHALRRPANVAPDVDSLTAILAQRSLILPSVEAGRVVVHRLVQRVLRERLQYTRHLDPVLRSAADALSAAAAEHGNRWATRSLIADYTDDTRTLAGSPADTTTRRRLLILQQDMLNWLGEVHNYSTVITLGAPLVADLEQALGPDHPNTMWSRGSLAAAYRAVRRLDEAIALGERTVADRERVLGPDHPDTLWSRSNLAAAYRDGGRPDEAIALDERTVADRERVLGPDHPDTLWSRNNLAVAYRVGGRLDEAIALHERTVADRERVLGPDHPNTLWSRNNLAAGYRAVGRLDEATALDERTVADLERVLGPDHPDTLWSRNNLAADYRAVGRLDEAIALHERTVADRERVLGPDHPHTLWSRNNLANARSQRLEEQSAAAGVEQRSTATSSNEPGATGPVSPV
ncbi:FxSxx-COOH system tetratricopeptide repeat protein [Dactylosporangium darangshiense]|uniref:FxSxx-COOH system tetratricopeptide repeat protein n=1 Tax=Dactylosporangium darangshiense TaxID=579108 RepID=A0ABP8DV05_9ACTN